MDFWRIILEYIKNYGAKICHRGATSQPQGQGGRGHPPGRATWACGALVGPLLLPFGHKIPITLEKITEKFSGLSAAVCEAELGRSTFALRRSDSAGETSLREGEIEAFIITNTPIIMDIIILINIFTSTISSQNPSSSLVFNLCIKPQIGTWGRLVVLITSCS